MFSRPWFLALVVALLGALMLFASCGGGDDDDSSGDDDSDEPTATEAAQDDEGDEGDDEADATPTEAAGDDDGDDDGGSGDSIDVCSLLTDVEVEFILDAEVGEPSPNDFDPFFGCLWETEDAITFRNINVGLYRDDRDAVEAYYELTTDAEEVFMGSVAERAQWSTAFLMQLEVLEGNCDLTISISGLDEEEARDGAIGLAERALGRLDGC